MPDSGPAPQSPWSLLASCWEDLFPLRQPRLDLALALAPAGARTLDAGCATGSLPRALAARGRLAEGLDLEPAFLREAEARARADGMELRWHEASLLDLAAATGPGPFQLITCLGQTLPHLLEEGQWLDFFTQARGLLHRDGHLVIQVVNDAGLAPGASRDLPPLRCPGGTLERRRTMLSTGLAQMETVFRPAGGEPVQGAVRHLPMKPAAAAGLMRRAGLEPGPPQADESGRPFEPGSPGWVLQAGRR
jgi:2-polyprenyl-3-methyl-5-hydroxy-6-metoxy-1,4-benzoquinol methylase